MRIYAIYDNFDRIYDIANTEKELREIWDATKVARILSKGVTYKMGLIETSVEELKANGIELLTDGNVVRFSKEKKKNFAGYSYDGKTILSREVVDSEGYYKLHDVEELDNAIIADTERVPYDYFPNITYAEFLEVLKYNGFKIGFIEEFKNKYNDCGGKDYLVFAYDMETHMVIVAESWNSGECLNTIKVYCPGMNCFENDRTKNKLFIQGDSNVSVFNLTYYDVEDKNIGVIHSFKSGMKEIVANGKNMHKGTIDLSNYVENKNNISIEESSKKIKRADKEDMLELFGQSEEMMRALNS